MSYQKYRVLVVDDEESIRELVIDAFEMEDFQVSSAENGQVAWDLWKSSEESSAPFHIVVSDFHMPEMNGVELLEHLSQDPKENPIFYLCSGTLESVAKEIGEHEHAHFISKPYDVFALLDKIKEELGD